MVTTSSLIFGLVVALGVFVGLVLTIMLTASVFGWCLFKLLEKIIGY